MQKTKPRQGFSLIEITLALGIISFAFVALFGMIPIGLNAFATAIDATVETQIMQRVTTIARQAQFSKLADLDRYPGQENGEELADFFFNEQADEVVDQGAIAARSYVYTAAVTLRNETDVPTKGANAANPNLATMNIFIKRISAPKEVRLVSVLIANNGL